MEGLSAKAIATRFGAEIKRYHLLGNIGFVSDDTELSALVAQSLIRYPRDPANCARAFQMSLLGWFFRLPFGIGRATSFACLRILAGVKETGVRSAGNGAAMRAAIIGVFFHDERQLRVEFGSCLARVTHIDERAVEAALFVAEMAAAAYATRQDLSENCRFRCFDSAIEVVLEPSLRTALQRARRLASENISIEHAMQQLGCSGFVNHSVPLSVYAFLASGGDTLAAVETVIKAGGDTDTNAAMVGAWCGALYGEKGLPEELINRINDGPFGPSHLRLLARALVACKGGNQSPVPTYIWPAALSRNVALIPVILCHAIMRIGKASP